MAWLWKSLLRKHVLATLACGSIGMFVILYLSNVLMTKQPDQQPRKYLEARIIEPVQQPHWLDAVRRCGLTRNLAGLDLNSMAEDQLFLTLHSYLDNIDTVCKRKLRMGHIDDGGWEVCDDVDVRPTYPCIVYSYGINRDWSFDDDISKLYGCHVFSFDPSISLETHNRSSMVHFHKLGISGQRSVNDRKWQLYRHEEIRSILKHETTAIDVIKMDVENAEWRALDDMIATNQFNDVKQLFIEFHVSKKSSLLVNKLKTLKYLELVGFQRFHVHKNKNCKLKDFRFPIRRTFCYEVHYIKRFNADRM